MQFIITLLSNPVYIDLAQNIWGWAGWIALLVLIGYIFSRLANDTSLSAGGSAAGSEGQSWQASPVRRGLLFAILFIAAPACALFFAIRLPDSGVLPLPGRVIETASPLLITFAALPWLSAALFLGLYETFFVALASGLTLALWNSHNPFTPLEIVILALLAFYGLKQNFRTFEFRLLRNPIINALVLALLYPLLFIFSNLFYAGGSLANRLDYAFTMVTFQGAALGVEMLLAGIFTWLVGSMLGVFSLPTEKMKPSPWERSLPARIIYNLAPLAVILVVTILVGNWWVAGQVAKTQLEKRLASSAQLASDTLPYFLETGQNLIQQIAADERWFTLSSLEQSEILREQRINIPFFDELYLIAADRSTAAAYPPADYEASSPPPAEIAGIELALQGVPVQKYTVPAETGASSAQISFIAGVVNSTGEVKGVLIGRANLASNPFTQPVIENLNMLTELSGSGVILDENGQVLYHTNPDRLDEPFEGELSTTASFYESQASDGTRNLVYFQPSRGYAWSVVLTIPARDAQEQALEIAGPTLLITLISFIIAGGILTFGLRIVTRSLKTLSQQANRMAGGQLDQTVLDQNSRTKVDEVALLGSAFEQMRLNLKARMDELNRLLVVSQGVASTLDIAEAIKPVLESAVSTGASSARIVLGPAALPDIETGSAISTRYGSGPSTQRYAAFDDAILELGSRQERLAVSNAARTRSLNLPASPARPEALLVIALRHELVFYGVLWLAYDQAHTFSEDEIRFITTLGSQIALAAANARLFQNAEIGRQRLASILTSTIDPVLVTDHQDRLVLANPAAWHALGLNPDTTHGRPVSATIQIPELAALLRQPGKESGSLEITALDQRVYLATASPIIANNRIMGRVCILRDVTHFKELDALKSDFVSTVSHDLRSPLTVMRGYTTMLEMVGQLNDQQKSYIQKIVAGVDTMSSLVNNLLDLGRIEAGIQLQLEFADVHDIIQRVIEPLQGSANQKNISLTTQMPAGSLPPVQADQALLQQALHNLVENAIKYTDPGGKVQLMVKIEESGIMFTITDTGIGIAPIDQPRLFEKFYRGAQREARKRSGSGLGLAIVKSIADRHNGKIWVESNLGKGSAFNLVIPLRHASSQTKGESQ